MVWIVKDCLAIWTFTSIYISVGTQVAVCSASANQLKIRGQLSSTNPIASCGHMYTGYRLNDEYNKKTEGPNCNKPIALHQNH